MTNPGGKKLFDVMTGKKLQLPWGAVDVGRKKQLE